MVVCLKVKTDKIEKSSPAWASVRLYLKKNKQKRSEKGKKEGLGGRRQEESIHHTGRLQLFALVKKVKSQPKRIMWNFQSSS